MKIAFIDVGSEYHVLYVTFNEVSRHWCVSYLHSCIVSCDHISKKFWKKIKVMRELPFFPLKWNTFLQQPFHMMREIFRWKIWSSFLYIVHYFESQTILWQFFKCNGIFSQFFFCVLYEKQRRGPFVVGRLWVKVFNRTYHYIWSIVWQHNNTFSSLEFLRTFYMKIKQTEPRKKNISF